MSKKSGFKKIINKLFKIGVICAYVLAIVVLVWQALTPGKVSGQISNQVGDKIDEIITETQKPTPQEVKVSSVKITSVVVLNQNLKGEQIDIPLTVTGKIKCEVLPSNATNPALSYQSSNESVVKTYSDGSIQGLAIGSATVTVTSQENGQLTAIVNVNVVDIPVEDIAISNIPSELHVGQSARLGVAFTPTNTSQRSVKWTSSNTSVLTVSSNGTVKGISEGSATVTLTSLASAELIKEITITVLPKVVIPVIPVESISIKNGNVTDYIGNDLQLTVSYYPSNANGNRSLSWNTSDENIATVSQSGVVTCLKAGTVTITAKCLNYEAESSITLTVKEVLSKNIVLTVENLTEVGDHAFSIKQGNSAKISATLDENATIKTVEYSSSDTSIAKINPDGVIETIGYGTVTIIASTSYDGEITSREITLTVNRLTFSDNVANFYYVVRKAVGHFGAFLVLGILATLTYCILFPKNTKGRVLSFIVCLIAGFAVAGLTEFLQLYTPGRFGSFKDVMLDFDGYCIAAVSMYFVVFVVHFIKLYRHKRKVKNNS